MPSETFGDRLARARQLRGWTQKECSAITGISVTFLSEIENDHRDPGMKSLAALGEHLGVSIDWLVFGASRRPPV